MKKENLAIATKICEDIDRNEKLYVDITDPKVELRISNPNGYILLNAASDRFREIPGAEQLAVNYLKQIAELVRIHNGNLEQELKSL